MRVSAQERGDEEACVLVVEVAFWSRECGGSLCVVGRSSVKRRSERVVYERPKLI